MSRYQVAVPEFAKLTRVTEKTVLSWISSGMPVKKKGAPGRGDKTVIELREAIDWWFEEHYERRDLDREKARLAKWQADRAEQDVLMRAGEMLDREETQRWIASDYANVKARLVQIPDDVASTIPPDVALIVAAGVRKLIDDALAELSAEAVIARIEQEGADPAAQAHDQSMV